MLALSGANPIPAYEPLFAGAFGGQRELAETLVMATPLILGGLAFAVASRAGLFNIGIEGQMVVGGLCAGLAAAWDPGLPIFVHLPLAVLAGMIAGGIWGFIPGFLKAQTGAEVITTIMLNYLAYRISTVVIGQENLPLVNPALQATPAVDNARLPRLIEGTRLHGGILIALVAAVVVWFLLYRTVFGYKIRTVGLSPGAAAFAESPGADDRAGHAPQWIACRTRRHGRRAWSARSLLQHHPRDRFHLDRRWPRRAQQSVRRRPGRTALRSAGFRGDEDAEHGWHLSGYRLCPARVRHPVRIGARGGATVPPTAAGSQSAWHDTRPRGARRRRSAGGAAAVARDLTGRRRTLDELLSFFRWHC